jgi:hypothetical protein
VWRARNGEFVAAQEPDQFDVELGLRYQIRHGVENSDVVLHASHKKKEPSVSDKLRQFGYLGEHVVAELLRKNELVPCLCLGASDVVRIRKDKHGDNAQLISGLRKVASRREMALVGRVERSGEEQDLISRILSESRPTRDETWPGGMALRAEA